MAKAKERETPVIPSPWKQACQCARRWRELNVRRYSGNLYLELIRGLMGEKIRQQEDLIGLVFHWMCVNINDCVCVCVCRGGLFNLHDVHRK